jgi:hypothetical protein
MFEGFLEPCHSATGTTWISAGKRARPLRGDASSRDARAIHDRAAAAATARMPAAAITYWPRRQRDDGKHFCSFLCAMLSPASLRTRCCHGPG